MSPGGQIYVSAFYHQSYRYSLWLLPALSCGDRKIKSMELINKFGRDNLGWAFTNDIFKCVLFKERFCILFHFQRIWLSFVQLITHETALIPFRYIWPHTGDKLLPEPVTSKFSVLYMCQRQEWDPYYSNLVQSSIVRNNKMEQYGLWAIIEINDHLY